jgi:hypothetical protein
VFKKYFLEKFIDTRFHHSKRDRLVPERAGKAKHALSEVERQNRAYTISRALDYSPKVHITALYLDKTKPRKSKITKRNMNFYKNGLVTNFSNQAY